jgi:type IV secretion system protein VirB10
VKRFWQTPKGVLPKNAQRWAIASISLVMVVVIAFSGRNTPKEPPAHPLQPAPPTDSTQARIEEYRGRIEEQRRRLTAEQVQLEVARRSVDGTPVPMSPSPSGVASLRQSAAPSYFDGSSSAADRQRDEIAALRVKREYESRFVSNLAIGRPVGAPAEMTNSNLKKPSSPRTDTIPEGTVIETVLTNRLDGAFSGPVNCLVTSAVYSRDLRRVLIPPGSRVLGDVQKVDSFGQQRLALAFHRLLMPDGRDVSLEASPGLNQVGETGLVDRVDRHYLQVFGVSLAIGAIAGFSQANTNYGVDRAASDAYRQGAASSVSQTSLNILDRYLNVLPTFTIEEGHRVKVYLTRDLTLPVESRAADR